jgi:hypothetical protein
VSFEQQQARTKACRLWDGPTPACKAAHACKLCVAHAALLDVRVTQHTIGPG